MARILTPSDDIKWSPAFKVFKWNRDSVQDLQTIIGYEPKYADFMQWGVMPDEVVEGEGNLLVTVGLNNLTKTMTGTGTTFTNAQGIVGVGSSTTAAAVGDTALGGNGSTTTAYYQGVDATYPTQSNGVITANSTFATGNANFAWQEWCWAVGTGTITAGGTLASVATGVIMLNHKVQSLGTKASGSTWTLQATITFS